MISWYTHISLFSVYSINNLIKKMPHFTCDDEYVAFFPTTERFSAKLPLKSGVEIRTPNPLVKAF